MRLQLVILSILAFISLVFLLTINPNDDDQDNSRIVHENEQEWMKKNHLLLPSKWRQVTPPTPNSAKKNPDDFNELNFAAIKKRGLHLKTKQLLLPSMLWKPVSPPTPNSGINSNPTLGQKTYASLQTRKLVSPPGPNPGQNSIPTMGEKNFASSKLKSRFVLLPSLQKGAVPSPGSNPEHNLAKQVEDENLAGLKMGKSHIEKKGYRFSSKLYPSAIPSGKATMYLCLWI